MSDNNLFDVLGDGDGEGSERSASSEGEVSGLFGSTDSSSERSRQHDDIREFSGVPPSIATGNGSGVSILINSGSHADGSHVGARENSGRLNPGDLGPASMGDDETGRSSLTHSTKATLQPCIAGFLRVPKA